MLAQVQSPADESPLEPPPVPLVVVAKPGKRLFTPENARAMAAKATVARARLRAERIARAQTPDPVPDEARDYVKERITRTRAHICKLDKQLEKERDPQSIKWLSDSIAKLQDVERILSGRPAPAPFKPSKRATNRDTVNTLAPVD